MDSELCHLLEQNLFICDRLRYFVVKKVPNDLNPGQASNPQRIHVFKYQ